ncbi:hypothetical protein [Siphonobacter sp. SORGH_AS_1065]|uniref:hypothetical protein n=1 Tax=Siphonobacter sp. SORGH_AS_1065 TaxID=3041795 RepID=UPI00277E18D8|nr:hypothetical protein [Siphonobacter sp. SORGH_AS_1065]MDQ1086748.1 hypothetical protein [Siphonobacter sp. SORGH_AS_1065]
MERKIENLSDLQAERARLKNQLEVSKVQIKRQLDGIKDDINPARQVINTVSGLMAKPENNLFSNGIGRGIDLALQFTPLGRAAWPLRMLVPFAVKRVTTNFLNSNGPQVLEKSLIWVKNVTDERPAFPAKISLKPEKSLKEKFFSWLKDVTEDHDPEPKEAIVIETLPLTSPDLNIRTPL